MPDVSFQGLLVVAAIAVAAPLLVALVPRIKVPAVVLEIVAGIAVGPSGFGWVKIDLPIQILALVGLAFLLFLAGLEIDLVGLKGRVLRVACAGFVLSLLLGLGAGVGFHAIGWVKNPMLIAIALSATSLGLVIPVLKDADLLDSPVGQLTVAGSTVADFGAIVLLSLLFSQSEGGAANKLVVLAGFVAVAVAVGFALSRAEGSMRFGDALIRLQDSTAEIRVRIAVLLLLGFVVMAERIGLETILGAFFAGALVNLVDRDAPSHPHFRLKLEAIGYGFVIPVFFVTSGLRFDLRALVDAPSAILRVPLFLLALVVARAAPAALYSPTIGLRAAVAAGLLQATSLPFLVTASAIGVSLDVVRPVTAAALVTAGLLSVVLFPLLSLNLLRSDHPAGAREGESGPQTAEGM